MTDQELLDLKKRLESQVPYQGRSNIAFLCHAAAAVIGLLREKVVELEKQVAEQATNGLVSKRWWAVRRVANGDERRPWYELTDEERDALVARGCPLDTEDEDET